MQLSYSFYHLATNSEDRRRIVDDPALIRPAIEEFLRYYAFVSPARKAVRDTEISGCPVNAGQMVWLPLASANRDPREFPDADSVLKTARTTVTWPSGRARTAASDPTWRARS
jgi:cytochrome P450